MFSWIKKYLIPHKSNNHTPHLLRNKGTRNILVAIIFLEIFSFIIPTLLNINMLGGLASVLPSVLNDLTNIERKSQNLPELKTSSLLNHAAQMKAEDMASKGYFAHTSPDGKKPWYWLKLAGYKYEYAGENLAVNFTDSKDITNAWLKSPSHKANIVKINYTEIGTGIATGTYKGQQAIFVAQVYANPLPAQNKVANTIPRETKTPAVKPVQKTSEQKVVTPPSAPSPSKNVLGEEIDDTPKTNRVTENNVPSSQITIGQKIVTSPRNSTNVVFLAIFLIMSFTTALYVSFNKKRYDYRLVNNGLLIVVIVGAIMVSNYYYSLNTMVTTSNIDYSIEDTEL